MQKNLKIKVLVVDDDEEFANLLGLLLSKKGFDTRVVYNAAQALDAVRETCPPVIVLDYMLPDVNGMELLDKLKDACPGAYVIIITAKGNEEVAVELMKAGAADYLKKPFDAEKLLTTIDNILKLRSSVVERDRLNNELMALNALSSVLTSDIPRQDKYRSALDIVMNNMGADMVNLFDIGKNGHSLELKFSLTSVGDPVEGCKVGRDTGISSYVAKIRKTAMVSDFSKETRFKVPEELLSRGLNSALATPLIVKDNLKGVLAVYNKGNRTYLPYEMKLMASFANQVAQAVDNDDISDIANFARNQWYATFDAIPDRVTVVDLNHKILMANKAAAEVAGLNVKEMIGQQCCWLFHNRKEPITECPVNDVVSTKGPVYREVVLRNPDETIQINAYPIFDENGNVEKVVEHVKKI